MKDDPIDRAYMDLRIREIMQAKGVTGIELAQRLGKHSQYIYNIINGGPQASVGALISVAKALGVPFRELFGPGQSEGEPAGTPQGQHMRAICPHCGHELNIEIS